MSEHASAPATLAALLERVGGGFVVLDRALKVRDGSTQLLGEHARFKGVCLWDAFPAGAGSALDVALRRALAEGCAQRLELGCDASDRCFEVHIYPAAEGLAVLFCDVSEFRRASRLLTAQRDLLHAIARSQPLAESLAGICQLVEREAPGLLCSILLLEDDGVHLRHGAAPSLPESYLRAIDGLAIGPQAGSCGTAAYLGAAVIVEDIAVDPRWEPYRAAALAHGLRACWSTPIFGIQGRVVGTFAMYYSQAGAPQPRHQFLIEVATETAAVAIEHAHTLAGLRALALRLQEAEQAQRNAINRELHDRVGQNLSALSLMLTMIQDELPADCPASTARRLHDAQAVLAETVRQVRDVMAELRPPALDEYGLAAALRTLAQTFAQRTGLHVALIAPEPTVRLPRATETALFRIAQEALANIAKHARARRIEIRLQADAHDLTLEVRDDGAGFAPTAQAQAASWGSQTMRERAAAVGAELQVQSAPGQGTCVTVRVPRGREP
ncbi:MAG: GAF domain-containing protein [Sutterellaceae bacterium]|nr:GAF domain-containing protein [Burkholderiaceae bacterium]MDW8429628.1 GAF domain-containing protein [Sutterellaceae bacterium]